MTKRYIFLFISLIYIITAKGQFKHWTVADGLPTGEVRQIIELPNRQMLVNCEGAFCISDGKGFRTLTCDRNNTLRTSHYTKGYAYLWDGDSLLWLRDYYRIYLFDTRIRSFRYDFDSHINKKQFSDIKNIDANEMKNNLPEFIKSYDWSYHLSYFTIDHDGGMWAGTRTDGIYYFPNHPYSAKTIIGDENLLKLCFQTIDSQGRIWQCQPDGLLCEDKGHQTLYNSSNIESLTYGTMYFICELPDNRFLICHNLNEIGYFYLDKQTYVSLNDKLPVLSQYRNMVGSCLIDDEWAAIYTQNGAFLLNYQSDTISAFPHTDIIENYSDKYNCMLKDSDNRLWVGTQNGLFCLTPTDLSKSTSNIYKCEHIEGISNNCIRSLVTDGSGNVWVGTSCGISRITPSIINLSTDDGVPLTSMRDHGAFLTQDKQLLFAYRTNVIEFHPDSIINSIQDHPVVWISITSNNKTLKLDYTSLKTLSFPYNQNNILIEFSSLNYSNPLRTRYRYRLQRLDNKWYVSQPLSEDLCKIEYHALAPGTYTFEVQKANNDGKWYGSTSLTIEILPPLWLTWWAKILYFLLFTSIIAYLINLYIKRRKLKLEKENDERVNHLFELREEARHNFAVSTNINPKEISINNEEEILVKRMLHAIEEHMSDADYGVDQLASDVFLSRSSLYSKLGNMLGITPSDFIRNVRLKHAAQLLIDTSLPINEIAERVGYNTHKTFSANFKKMFNMLPSEYRAPKE